MAKTVKPAATKTTKPAEVKKIDNSPEAKQARFKLIAGRRVKKLLTGLQNLGNCANTNVYSFDAEQVNKIFAALEKQLYATKDKYTAVKEKKEKLDFNL